MSKLVLLVIAGLLAAAAVPGTAKAGGVSVSIALQAKVPGICLIGRGRHWVSVAVTLPTDANGAISTAPQTVTFPATLCNTSASVTVGSLQDGAMIAGDTAGADGKIDYLATASFGGAGASANTASSASGSALTGHPAMGTLTVSIQPLQPAGPMLPSSVYTDTITVALLPR